MPILPGLLDFAKKNPCLPCLTIGKGLYWEGNFQKGNGAVHEVALLKPDIQIRSLADLDLFRLRQKGIKAVLIDLDNTISPWRQNRITREARDFFRRAAAEGIRVILFTNAKEPRARKAAAAAGLEVFPAAKKPFPGSYARIREQLGLKPAQILTIGDQIFTDTLGGNLAGCTTVLIPPLENNEYGGTKILRFLERLVGVRQTFRRPAGGSYED